MRRKSDAAQGVRRIERTFRVISPVFGGGVHINSEPARQHLKDIDRVTPIRPAEVRGQLRFWWRATAGARLGSIAEMREREREIFGVAGQPGRVSLVVEPDGGLTIKDVDIGNISSPLGYGTFPLRGAAGAPSGVLHQVTGPARLVVRVASEFADEVDRAIDAWLTFGGIGGRTRRGFGAVAPENGSDPSTILGRVALQGETLAGVPALVPGRLRVRQAGWSGAQGGQSALEAGLGTLRRIRQGDGVGRNRGQGNRPGRSSWPEADEIRRVTGRASPQHRAPLVVNFRKFPRAAFGMPIIFHFKDRDEPRDTQLVPKGHDRLASPLIIRPYLCPGGQQYGCLALVLADPARAGMGVVLRGAPGDPAVDTRLTPAEAERVKPLGGNPDPLGAFLDFFSKS